MKIGEIIGVILLIIFVLAILSEIGLQIYLITTSNSHKCNLFWCEFTSKEQYMSQTQVCFTNDKVVDCNSSNITYTHIGE